MISAEKKPIREGDLVELVWRGLNLPPLVGTVVVVFGSAVAIRWMPLGPQNWWDSQVHSHELVHMRHHGP